MPPSSKGQPRHDEFNEDLTELNFLRSKPTCFIVVGKPGCGKSTLAEKLSHYWRCELVNGTETIQKEIEMSTEVGKKIQEVLFKGESLSNEFVMQLIREKVASLEVAHYGYVLDSMPIVDDDILSVTEQIEIIQNWKLTPDIIINIKCPDVDLVARREGFRTDSHSGETFPKKSWDPPTASSGTKAETSIIENGEEEDEEEALETEVLLDYPEIDKESKNRLIHAPENIFEHVEASNTLYKDVALKTVENFMTDHDQHYVIELDGNLGPILIFKQLLSKLETYNIRRASVPTRLQNPDEEELPDEIETDELLRMLASYQMPAPRYRWRRSKWGRNCPVALKEGSILQGKPDLAVSFLDKIYVMSSPEALSKFLKNPRPYLLPPMPAPPCKIAVIGFPLSGKTTISQCLAKKYKATVFDMKELMKDKINEAKSNLVAIAKQEALESAITLVQNKLEQEALERIEIKKSKSVYPETDVADQDEDVVSIDPSDSASLIRNEESSVDPNDIREASPVPIVTDEHPEVKKIVDEAVNNAEKQEVKLPPSDYVAALKDAIDNMIAKRLEEDSDSPKNGGWILDNFPETKEQWAALLEISLVPDEVIFLVDKSPNVETIRQRFYEINKQEITEQFRQRLLQEKQEKLSEEEMEQERFLKEQEELSVIANQKTETNTEDDSTDVVPTETDENEKVGNLKKFDVSTINKLRQEIADFKNSYIGVPPYDSQEFQNLRDRLAEFDKEWSQLQNSISGSATSKPIIVEIKDKSTENIIEFAVKKIENLFGYNAWEFSGIDLDEEEEDANADAEVSGEQEEEDEEAVQHKKKHFGYTKHYDPVALKNEGVLWPGNPDIAGKYRERIYYFKSTEFREIFVKNPLPFLPTTQPLTPPAPRILILGARGSGKTLHGRWLSEKLGTFHISFRERLQELILPKTKRKLGPEHEEDRLLKKELSVTISEAVKAALDVNEQNVSAEDQVENFDLNDEEEAIKSNLEDDEPLPPEILEKIVTKWWRTEPYRSVGFVLEGFPRTVEECQFLVQSGLFPDACLLLMVEDKDVITRLLPGQMDKWIARKKFQSEKKDKIRQAKLNIKKAKMEKRRQELIKERDEAKLLRDSERDENEEEDDEEEEDDIEETIANEFEDDDEGEEEDEEQEEDAKERMKSEFGERFDDEVGKLQTVQESFEESSIPRIEVQASRKSDIVKYLIEIKMKSILDTRNGIFERVYPLSQDVAQRMLISGYKHPSSFGKWDPVKLLEKNDVIQPVHGTTNPAFPVAYNQYIYFLSSNDSRNKFIANPQKYITNAKSAKPVVPIQIAIVGPPKSGKTTLSKRFSSEYGVFHVSIGKSIRDVLEKQPDSVLAKHIMTYLYDGQVIPDRLAVECLATTLLDTLCTTRGYVLDGFPCTEAQITILHAKGIVPVKIFELDIDGKEVLKRSQKDRIMPNKDYVAHDSDKITILKHTCYKEQITAVQTYYENQHQNWVHINGLISKWKLWSNVIALTKENVEKIQIYLDQISKGEAACLSSLCISPSELEVRLGEYGHYCPVSLNLKDELVDCSERISLTNAAEFRSKYYKFASETELKLFLEKPEQFVTPLAKKHLPEPNMLPRRISHSEAKSLFPKQVELNGYCAVTFYNGKLSYESLVEGSSELVAEYKNKLYMFKSEMALKMFLRRPHLYSDLVLPKKLPPKKQLVEVRGLPMLGYLEQGAAESITKALTAAGCFKPKFPFLSVKKSVLTYVACHLKAFNPKSSTYSRKKYKQMLTQFEECCNLISYLGTTMTRRYTDPIYRPLGFDNKMHLFLSLADHPPRKNWVM